MANKKTPVEKSSYSAKTTSSQTSTKPKAASSTRATLKTPPASTTATLKVTKTVAPLKLSKPQPLSHAEVAQRAYELFCKRGYVHGYDVEDWIQAERDIRAR